jgi:hypothetical protein
MSYEIYQCVCLSTAHITRGDAIILADAALLDLSKSNMIMSRKTGFFIKLYEEEDLNRHRYLSDIANHVIEWAWERGFRMIELDCDGPIIDELPRFEW